MIHKITLIHSIHSVIDRLMNEFSNSLPEINIFNILDESLLPEFKAAGGLNNVAYQKVYRMVQSATESGSELILFSCSSISPIACKLEPFFSIPILPVDEKLFREVVKRSNNLVIFGTAISALKASKQGLEKANMIEKRNTKFETIVCSMDANKDSEIDLYKNLADDIEKKYTQLDSVDTILLAQLSMIPVIEYLSTEIKNKITPTIPYMIEHVKEQLGKIN